MKHRIYALKDPDSELVKYVGITKKKLEERLYTHLHTKTSNKLNAWFEELKEKNKIPEIILLEEFEGKETNEKEVFYMNKFKNTILNVNFKIQKISHIEKDKYFSTFAKEKINSDLII